MRWQSDMIRRVHVTLTGILLAVGLLCSAQAQLQNKWIGGHPLLLEPVAAAYTGPGDVVSGAPAWWGLRAYSQARVSNKAVRLVRASDSTQQDINTLANGNLDVSAASTFCNATTCKVVTLYDQTGSTNCTGPAACDLTQATDASRPAFTFNCIGSLPCMTFAGSQSLAVAGGTFAQPNTASGVYKRTSGGVSTAFGTGAPTLLGFAAGANTLEMYAGGTDATASPFSDGSFHAVQATYNGASSELYADGSANPVTTGTASFSGTYTLGTDAFAQPLTGAVCEMGIWNLAFSSGNKSSMNSNQHTYWGF